MSNLYSAENSEVEVHEAAYVFGPIENKRTNIVALLLQLSAPLPASVEEIIMRTMGTPTIKKPDFILWKLKRAISYIDDEWRWLYNAIEWQADQIGEAIEFHEGIWDDAYAEAVANIEGPLFDIYGSESQDLISRFKADRQQREQDGIRRTKKEEKGHQRVMYKTWAAFKESDLKPVDRMAVLAILRYCWSKHQCEVWEDTLAADVGCNVSTLRRSFNRLVRGKWLKITHRHRQKSVYHIVRKDLIPPFPKSSNRVSS